MIETRAEDWHVEGMFPLGRSQQKLIKIPVPNRDLCVVLYNEDEVRMGWYYADLAIVRNRSNPEVWIGKERGIWVDPFAIEVSDDGKYLFCSAEAYNKEINEKHFFALPFFIIDLDEVKACVIHHQNACHYNISQEIEGIFTLRLNSPNSNGRFPSRDGEQIPIKDLDWEPLQTMRYHYDKYARSGLVKPYKEILTFRTLVSKKFWRFLTRISLLNERLRFSSRHYPKFIHRFVSKLVVNIQIFKINRKNRS